MINKLRSGSYSLLETADKKRILFLDEEVFFWNNTNGIGELALGVRPKGDVEKKLCDGSFILFEIKDESGLTDVTHLELTSGDGKTQGYLLLSGLPDSKNNRKRIVPTIEKVPQGYV